MFIRNKTFCPNCYEKVNYYLESSMSDITVREVSFSYLETRARCQVCGGVCYVPAVNDKNVYERHKAYYNKLNELKELEHNG